jgi:hypothetical protein
MGIIIKIYLVCLFVFVTFSFVGIIVENFVNESHSVKKWWRRHIVGLDPGQKKTDDDIYE